MTKIKYSLFECTVRYNKSVANAAPKKVTEQYIVDATLCSEVENRITTSLAADVVSDFECIAIKRLNVSDVFQDPEVEEGKFFKAKVIYHVVTDSGSIKEVPNYFIVEADDIGKARRVLIDGLANEPFDYRIDAITATKYLFFYDC